MKVVTLKDEMRIGIQKDKKILDLREGYAFYLNKVKDLTLEEARIKSESTVPNDMTKFIKLGEKGLEISRKTSDFVFGKEYAEEMYQSVNNVRLGPPVPNPPKDLICLARNYPAYVEQGGMDTPTFPLPFMKARSAIIGPDDRVVFHPLAEVVNHEVELSVIIGKGGKDIPEEDAMNHVYGYTIMDEISASNVVKSHTRRGQFLGKSFFTFAPMGPALVLKEQIEDPHNLEIELVVDGVKIMDGNTRDMIFNIPQLISFLSGVLLLEPGDIIASGTPIAVGPLEYGQVCEASIEKLGTLRYLIG